VLKGEHGQPPAAGIAETNLQTGEIARQKIREASERARSKIAKSDQSKKNYILD